MLHVAVLAFILYAQGVVISFTWPGQDVRCLTDRTMGGRFVCLEQTPGEPVLRPAMTVTATHTSLTKEEILARWP